MLDINAIKYILATRGFHSDPYNGMVKGPQGHRVRYRFQQLVCVVEVEKPAKDFYGKPAAQWTRIGGGYYKHAQFVGKKLYFKEAV